MNRQELKRSRSQKLRMDGRAFKSSLTTIFSRTYAAIPPGRQCGSAFIGEATRRGGVGYFQKDGRIDVSTVSPEADFVVLDSDARYWTGSGAGNGETPRYGHEWGGNEPNRGLIRFIIEKYIEFIYLYLDSGINRYT